jgi:hypothetical protein
MQILRFIQQVPLFSLLALQSIRHSGDSIKGRVMAVWQHGRNMIKNNELWRDYIRPIYRRHIYHLTKADYLLFIGSLAIAGVIAVLAVQSFGLGIFPLSAICGSLLVYGSCLISAIRLKRHFNAKAAGIIQQLKNGVQSQQISCENLDPLIVKLDKYKFHHLKSKINEVKVRCGSILQTIVQNNVQVTSEAKQCLVSYLDILLQDL